MPFLVEVERAFTAVQGLPSPVRGRLGRWRIPAGERVRMVLRIGVACADGQLTDRGWFVDTDAAGETVDLWCARLAARPWPQQFAFRPTFELVTHHLYGRIAHQIEQLTYVELADLSFGSRTRYTPPG